MKKKKIVPIVDYRLCSSVRIVTKKFDVGEWAVIIFHDQPPQDFGDVVVGWYRTREIARQHAKKIRDAINILD